MRRFLQVGLLFAVVGASAPALARCRGAHGHVGLGHGVGIQLGSVFFGISRHHHAPCGAVVVAPSVVYAPPPPVVYAPAPPVVYAPPPVVQYEAPPPPVYAPPVVYSAPPPPPVVYAPQPPPPPVVPAAPVVQARVVPKAERPRPGFLAVKYMPGASMNVGLSDRGVDVGGFGFAHSPGVELRIARWFSLRSDLEFRQDSRTWDMLGVKLSLFPNSPVKPYASVSFSATELLANQGAYSFGFVGAGGLDVFLGRHFFLEAEVRYRVVPGACCSEVPSVTGVVGGGVAFF